MVEENNRDMNGGTGGEAPSGKVFTNIIIALLASIVLGDWVSSTPSLNQDSAHSVIISGVIFIVTGVLAIAGNFSMRLTYQILLYAGIIKERMTIPHRSSIFAIWWLLLMVFAIKFYINQ